MDGLRRTHIFLGEVSDARLAIPGWDRAGFDASSWRPVRVGDHALLPLKPLLDMPPVRAAQNFPAVAVNFPAVAVNSPEPGLYIVDFGKNFTGLPEIELRVPAGTLNPMTGVAGQIKGTRKDADGNEVSVGGPDAPAVAWQQDVYIARGGGQASQASQSEQAFALGFGATPEAAGPAVFAQHVKSLTAPEDGPSLTTGIYGIINESGKPLAEADGVTVLDSPIKRLKVGSGHYRFLIMP